MIQVLFFWGRWVVDPKASAALREISLDVHVSLKLAGECGTSCLGHAKNTHRVRPCSICTASNADSGDTKSVYPMSRRSDGLNTDVYSNCNDTSAAGLQRIRLTGNCSRRNRVRRTKAAAAAPYSDMP